MFVLFPLHTLNFSDSAHIAHKHNPHIADLTKKTFITENSKTARDVSSHSLQVKASNPDIFKTTFSYTNHSSVHTKPANLLLIHRWPIHVKKKSSFENIHKNVYRFFKIKLTVTLSHLALYCPLSRATFSISKTLATKKHNRNITFNNTK